MTDTPSPNTTHHAPEHEQARERRRYTPPSLEALGEWSALTLQQTVPISGYTLLRPDRLRRLF